MEDEKMETSKTERDWLRNISEKRTTPTEKEEKKETQPKAAKKKPAAKKERQKNGHGFGDIAGMDSLKQMVREGFINVLQNHELAEAYGIRPPFYALLRSGRMRQDILRRKNGRGSGHTFYKGGA